MLRQGEKVSAGTSITSADEAKTKGVPYNQERQSLDPFGNNKLQVGQEERNIAIGNNKLQVGQEERNIAKFHAGHTPHTTPPTLPESLAQYSVKQYR